MILPAILYTLKGKLWLGISALFTTLAVTEAFMGQLVSALIAAIPPLIAIWLLARNQNEDRRKSNELLLAGQEEVKKAVDGQTSKLVEATEKFGRAAGKEQERIEERSRQGEAAIAAQAEAPTEVIQVNPPENPANVKVTQ